MLGGKRARSPSPEAEKDTKVVDYGFLHVTVHLTANETKQTTIDLAQMLADIAENDWTPNEVKHLLDEWREHMSGYHRYIVNVMLPFEWDDYTSPEHDVMVSMYNAFATAIGMPVYTVSTQNLDQEWTTAAYHSDDEVDPTNMPEAFSNILSWIQMHMQLYATHTIDTDTLAQSGCLRMVVRAPVAPTPA